MFSCGCFIVFILKLGHYSEKWGRFAFSFIECLCPVRICLTTHTLLTAKKKQSPKTIHPLHFISLSFWRTAHQPLVALFYSFPRNVLNANTTWLITFLRRRVFYGKQQMEKVGIIPAVFHRKDTFVSIFLALWYKKIEKYCISLFGNIS